MNAERSPSLLYETEALSLNASCEPVLYADFKAPRDVTAVDVQAMLDLSDRFVTQRVPFVPLVHLRAGSGIISSQARGMFADWIETRSAALRRDEVCAVIVVPEAIFRAVLRVVYRFRAAPMRTITVPDIDAAAEAVPSELARMAQPVTPALQTLLASVSERRSLATTAPR